MPRTGFLGRVSAVIFGTPTIGPVTLLTGSAADVKSELDSAWAVFMEDRVGGRAHWTQDQRWRADNPGEWAKLKAYRDGTGPRPALVTEPGRRMVFETAAWILSRTGPVPPADPVPPGVPEKLADYDIVVSVTGMARKIGETWYVDGAFLNY